MTNAGEVEVGGDLLRLTAAAMVVPMWVHVAFNGLTALCVALLGYPRIAVAAFVSACAVDAVFQWRIRRSLSGGRKGDLNGGFTRLALLMSVRNSILLAPATLMAVIGAAPQIAFLGVSVCSVMIMSGGSGMMSRKVFWSYAGPSLAAMAVFVAMRLTGAPAAAMALGLLGLALLLVLVSYGTSRGIASWLEAFRTNNDLIVELEKARDQAMAERAAADEAREEARRANLAKSNFLATMSHEIRTPMNGVLGMAQLLRRDETDPRQAERLEILAQSGEYLLAILNDILDISKIDAGRLEISARVEDLRSFMNHAVGFWTGRADEKGVAVRLEIDEAAPGPVWMDALRLRQVLFNLIGNALKFTDAGSVVVQVEAEPQGEGAVLVRLAVRDTGPGISAEVIPTLFERFSQGDEFESRRHGGAGLGLAIAKQLTELMGGRIWVESVVGEGSTFRVEMPLQRAEAPEASGAGDEREAEAAASDLEVLIVDDNAVNLQVLDQLLAAFGHRAAKASSGPEALDQLARQPFDVVLMDIQMPGMSGVETLQRLRTAPGPNQDTPVIALTADVTSGGRSRYVDLGFSDHSPKPIQIADLMETIARTVRARADAPQRSASA